jgi:hypothetical protein
MQLVTTPALLAQVGFVANADKKIREKLSNAERGTGHQPPCPGRRDTSRHGDQGNIPESVSLTIYGITPNTSGQVSTAFYGTGGVRGQDL